MNAWAREYARRTRTTARSVRVLDEARRIIETIREKDASLELFRSAVALAQTLRARPGLQRFLASKR